MHSGYAQRELPEILLAVVHVKPAQRVPRFSPGAVEVGMLTFAHPVLGLWAWSRVAHPSRVFGGREGEFDQEIGAPPRAVGQGTPLNLGQQAPQERVVIAGHN